MHVDPLLRNRSDFLQFRFRLLTITVPFPAPYLDRKKYSFKKKIWNFFAFLHSKLFFTRKKLISFIKFIFKIIKCDWKNAKWRKSNTQFFTVPVRTCDSILLRFRFLFFYGKSYGSGSATLLWSVSATKIGTKRIRRYSSRPITLLGNKYVLYPYYFWRNFHFLKMFGCKKTLPIFGFVLGNVFGWNWIRILNTYWKDKKTFHTICEETAPFPLSAPVACSMFVKLREIRIAGSVVDPNYGVRTLAFKPGQLNTVIGKF